MAADATAFPARLLLAFIVLYLITVVSKSATFLYFHRTGYVCATPQLLQPGDENWSGSSYCGDEDDVLNQAQRFTSLLVPVQLGFESALAPFFAGIADRKGYLSMITFGACANVVGVIVLAVAASSLDSRVTDFDSNSTAAGHAVQRLPIPTILAARLVHGMARTASP